MQQASNDLKSSRLMVLNLLILVVAFFFTSTSFAQSQATYPSKPIKLILPLAVGSAVDLAARIVTQKMSANMGQSFVIENIPGAAGLIGAEKVAKATADGYTLGGFNDGIITMGPNLNPNTPYDPLKDFAYISLVTTVEAGLVVPSNSPYKNIGQLLKAASQSPGKINYSSGGNGSPQHIAMALFNSQAGTSMTHVPYKGIMQAATGVAGGEVDIALIAVSSLKNLADAGKLKFIGVASQQRLAQFPNIPTISESGLPGFEFTAWFAFMAPQGTPKPIIQLINSEVKKALSDKDVREKMLIQGLYPANNTPEELQQLIRSQLISYGTLIKKMGLQPE
jgi:tripartite-type tricarboxylate transporter receptor subunit TctC